jgi:hypothetical protein
LGRIVEDVGGSDWIKRALPTIGKQLRGVIVMMSASFGREIADSHFRQLLAEAEHDRLVSGFKRERKQRHARVRMASVQRRAAQPCSQDLG